MRSTTTTLEAAAVVIRKTETSLGTETEAANHADQLV